MANELVKKGKMIKAGMVVTGIGAIASFFVYWWLGVILLGVTGFFGWKLLKNYAATGRRF